MSRSSLFVTLVALITLISRQKVMVSGNQGPASAQGQPVYGNQNPWVHPSGASDEQHISYGSQRAPTEQQQQNQGLQPGQQYGPPGVDPTSGDSGAQQWGQMRYGGPSQYGSQFGPPPSSMDMGGALPDFRQPQRVQEETKGGGGGGGINFGGILSRAKNMAVTAASAASTFVAGGPDLVPPP